MALSDTKSSLERAVRLLQAGQARDALGILQACTVLSPNNPQAFFLLGVAQHMLGENQAALAAFDRSIKLNPGAPEAHINRALVHMALGQFEDAVHSLDRAIKLKPRQAEYHYNRGLSLFKLGRFADAVLSYDRAIKANPIYIEALTNRGIALHALKRYEDAISSYGLALAIRSDVPEAYLNRGDALRALSRWAEALSDYDRALAYQPGLANAHSNRGAVLSELWRYDEAIESHRRALALVPSAAGLYINFAAVYVAQRHFQDAEAIYGHAIALDANNSTAYIGRGRCRRELGDFVGATQDYARAAELTPDADGVLGWLYECRAALCQWDGLDELAVQIGRGIGASKFVAAPYTLLHTTLSAAQQQACSRILTANITLSHESSQVASSATHRSPPRIRVGYISADFHQHAVMFLAAELFECHDRKAFEVIGVSYGPSPLDGMHRRVAATFDRFLDVRHLPDPEVAAQIRALDLDIAVDLTGYTGGGRPGIFSL